MRRPTAQLWPEGNSLQSFSMCPGHRKVTVLPVWVQRDERTARKEAACCYWQPDRGGGSLTPAVGPKELHRLHMTRVAIINATVTLNVSGQNLVALPPMRGA